MIPGLENAQFARLGGLHRNTFLNSPKVLDGELRLKAEPRLRFAGPDHRRRGLCRERGDRADGRADGGGRAARASAGRAPPATTALGRADRPHHRRAPRGGGRAGAAHLPADERQFRAVPRRSRRRRTTREGRKIKGKERGAARKRALSARALADLDRWLAAPAPGRGGINSTPDHAHPYPGLKDGAEGGIIESRDLCSPVH